MVISKIKEWLGLDNSKPIVQKLDKYEYELIDALVKVDVIKAYELADLLRISVSRAQYEINKSKDRLDVGSTTKSK